MENGYATFLRKAHFLETKASFAMTVSPKRIGLMINCPFGSMPFGKMSINLP